MWPPRPACSPMFASPSRPPPPTAPAPAWCWKSPWATTCARTGPSTTACAACCAKSRFSASTTTWASPRCRTCLRCALAMRCSSPCGGVKPLPTSRSPSPKNWAWKRAARSTTRPAHCATWCKTMRCNCCARSAWSHRSTPAPTPSATRSSRSGNRSSPGLPTPSASMGSAGNTPQAARKARPCRAICRKKAWRRAAAPRPSSRCAPRSRTGAGPAGRFTFAPARGWRGGGGREALVALRTEISNWRWAGVPFYIRTGKRLAGRDAHIVVNFHPVPHPIFRTPAGVANRLVINLQPKDGLELHLLAQGAAQHQSEPALSQVHLNLDFEQRFGTERVGAYERLLLDVIAGRLNLFVRSDEQQEAWRWVEPILQHWQDDPVGP